MRERAPLVFAHRGAHSRHRENTIPAFEEAHRLGADGIEFDVRMTRDGVLVVHHDERIPRLGRVAMMDSKEIPAYVPTFASVLEWLRTNPTLLADVELKERGHEAQVLEAVREARLTDRCVLTSFLPDVVFALAQHGSHPPLGWIVKDRADGLGALAAECGAAIVVLRNRLASPARTEEIQANGRELWVWDVETVRDAQRAADRGAAAVISDHVSVLRRHWPRSAGRPRTAPRKDRRGN